MRWILVLVTFVCWLQSQAQESRVIDGRKYLLHTVEQGQTLFAIGRHYAVPVEALLSANPGADKGLSIGQVLLVPEGAQVRKELKSAPALRDGELVHTVVKKETLFGLARKYGVDENVLIARNPGIDVGMKEGMQVVIPVTAIKDAAPGLVRPAVDDGAKHHLVIAGETLFSLGQAYGVDPDSIKTANGGLPLGLRAGSYVRIPAKVEPVKAPPTNTAVREPGAVKKVALLLPFSAGSAEGGDAEDGRMPAATDAAVQFYAGARLAMDSMAAHGMNIDLRVFDTGSNVTTWSKLFASDEVRGMDLYIGPFHRAAIESLVRVADGAHIVCPSPQSNKVLLGNPSVSKVISGKPDQWQQLARYVAHKYGRDRVLFCVSPVAAEKNTQDHVLRQLDSAIQQLPGGGRDSVVVVKPGRTDISGLIAKLDPSRTNAVVVPSEDLEFVTTLVSKLAPLANKYKIVLFGSSGWPAMDNISVPDLGKLSTHVPANAFVDHNDPRVSVFIKAYREKYQNEPGEYAYLGYDIVRFYMAALERYGRNFPEHFNEVSVQPLHLTFRFARAGAENGWRNENAVLLQYKDMELRPVQ